MCVWVSAHNRSCGLYRHSRGMWEILEKVKWIEQKTDAFRNRQKRKLVH